MLKIKNLHVHINNKVILDRFNLKINSGEIHAIMGPNGSGKSTLSYILVGKKEYIISKGEIFFKKKNLLDMNPEIRAREGIFASFQYPTEIPGVTNNLFLYTSLNEIRKYNGLSLLDRFDFQDLIYEKIKMLNIKKSFLKRFVNVGFSGGEKKINDILHMLILKPKLCILDEIDSGLDIDALKKVSKIINIMRSKDRSFIIITHYRRILDYVKPDYVHILYNNKIVKSSDFMLVKQLEDQGYGWLNE
ncbi:Fe-S cluster assembly ATPase SufC [Enterobacteriaceae endosymbiont of Plateumaris consimilis]|uniref:Fe-S cluster assembly ATPase SufC n=1 Tax=Enterobacteriaceae endosymbiont of Plateumaris consimilis TaxID=2675794 RepID=UPI001448F00C|nr:Fe-S cluster assembly ATPase SufC [Enterobacteriaceae endosymbiont of Plateumaris consimilis]QJC28757.1 Fe-S cluster assembly ATPase SufC [Enterobacteriaceae endosymbiont of Plateumaris consimilis]